MLVSRSSTVLFAGFGPPAPIRIEPEAFQSVVDFRLEHALEEDAVTDTNGARLPTPDDSCPTDFEGFIRRPAPGDVGPCPLYPNRAFFGSQSAQSHAAEWMFTTESPSPSRACSRRFVGGRFGDHGPWA